MELNWKEDSNLIRKLAKILLGDTLPNGKPVSSIILLDDTSRAELQRWANMSDAEFAAAQLSGDSIHIDVDDAIRQLEEKYALAPQLLDDLLSVFDADDLDFWEEISQWEDSDHDEPTEYFFSNPDLRSGCRSSLYSVRSAAPFIPSRAAMTEQKRWIERWSAF